MGSVKTVLRTCGLLLYLSISVFSSNEISSEPWISSVVVSSKECGEKTCKYLLNIRGGEYLGHFPWRLTPSGGARGGSCDVIYPNYEIREVETLRWSTDLKLSLPLSEGRVYFCLYHHEQRNSPFGGKYVHQGEELFLDTKNGVVLSQGAEKPYTKQTADSNNRANLQEISTNWADLSHDTDVNYRPGIQTPRDKRKDIEILSNGRYVALPDIDNRLHRYRRDFAVKDGGNNKRGMGDEKNKRGINGEDKKDIGEGENVGVGGLKDIYDVLNVTESDHDVTNEKYEDDNGVSVKKEDIDHQVEEIDELNDDRNSITQVTKDVDRLKREIVKMNNDISNVTKTDNKIKVDLKNSDVNITRFNRQVTHPGIMEEKDLKVRTIEKTQLKVEGLRIESSDKDPSIVDEKIPSVLADTSVTLRLFGEGFAPETVIVFTYDKLEYGQPCKFFLKGEYMAKKEGLTPKTAVFDIKAPAPTNESILYICAKNLKPGVIDPFMDEDKYFHQGTETYKIFATHNSILPLWFSICLIIVCLAFSALFSGLNLGLMSLDRTELKIIANTGTEQERKYARAIMPVRDHGNYLLCSILLGNVAVNSTFTILLDDLTSGLFAVIFSTLAIVMLGEITPQAICSRHGLMVGAKSIMITKAVMAVTAPLAFPVSKLLDYFLGEEIGNVYNRERLKELVKVTTGVNDLDKDEVNIISGALEMRKKKVVEVMTKLEDVFMLPITSVLDFETMSEIIKSGYSRIPVYEGHRGNIVTVLFIKDLAFVDPDDNTPLRTLCQYYQNPCNFVFEDVTLDVMFRQFKEGHKGHMAFVHRINSEGEGDPFYETIGLVTLEDVIEEMIQCEIIDETDVFVDNRSKRKRNKPQHKLQDFAAFAERHECQRIHISPQLTLATFQFLSTSVDAFRPDTVSETVLRRLLKQDVIQFIKVKGKDKKDPTIYVFQQGKPVDYFVLILEGRVEVTVGRENLVFEAGPFTYFGVQALTQNVGVAESPTPSNMGSLQNMNMEAMLRHTFVPDYSVRAVSQLYYLTVKRSLYLAAKRATLMEKGALSKGATNEQFDTEVDKPVTSSSANMPVSFISKKLLGINTPGHTSPNNESGSTSADHKSMPRQNIIELMQVAQQSERLDSASVREHSPNAHEQSPNASECSAEADCDESLKNNFWTIFGEIDNVEVNDPERSTKKKATFHTDSSLLTFYNSIEEEMQPKLTIKPSQSILSTKPSRLSTKESQSIDLDSHNRSIDGHCSRLLDSSVSTDVVRTNIVEDMILKKLSRIINLLEKRDVT